MDLEPLLPCPFCGGAAKQDFFEECYLIDCSNPLCNARGGTTAKSPQEAVAAWNQRVPVTPQQFIDKPFAIVIDRSYEGEGPSLAYHNGINYQFSDGDCYDREGDTLDGYTAEFLTEYELEQRLFKKLSFLASTQMVAAFEAKYGANTWLGIDFVEESQLWAEAWTAARLSAPA